MFEFEVQRIGLGKRFTTNATVAQRRMNQIFSGTHLDRKAIVTDHGPVVAEMIARLREEPSVGDIYLGFNCVDIFPRNIGDVLPDSIDQVVRDACEKLFSEQQQA